MTAAIIVACVLVLGDVAFLFGASRMACLADRDAAREQDGRR